MAKSKKPVLAVVKLQIQAGKASPAPPVGTALGPHGIAIQEFCSKFNDATKEKMGDIIPCVLTIYEDRTFDFILKTSPASQLIKKILKLKSGANKPLHETVAKITQAQLRAVAEEKLPDLNTNDVDQAMKTIAGTATRMGIEVID
jgi:large subunit ribosomal protein L11